MEAAARLMQFGYDPSDPEVAARAHSSRPRGVARGQEGPRR
jgi:hypothetical protein